MPSTDIVEIETLQEETEAALSRLYRQGGVSFSGLTDVGLSLKRTEVEGSLSAKELLDIAGVLETADLVKKYGEGAGLKPDSNDDSAEAGMDCLTGEWCFPRPRSPMMRRQSLSLSEEISS